MESRDQVDGDVAVVGREEERKGAGREKVLSSPCPWWGGGSFPSLGAYLFGGVDAWQ